VSEPVLSVHDLRVWYGTASAPVRAVDGVSFDVHAGETLGLVGESGCGKSTLGRAILGLLPESASLAGEVRYRDIDCTAMTAAEIRDLRGPDIGLIFQEPMTRLDPLMTIERHFLELLEAHQPGLRDEDMRERSLRALAAMGIPPTRFKQYPHEFSGGMRQRIMIALALVLRPAMLVADEPTTALDVIVEAQILGILADLRRSYDTALLLITHNLGIVAEACDRVAVMYAGELVEVGDAKQVFSQPAHPYTRELLASTISLSTTSLHHIPGAPPDLASPPPACRFHPRCPDAMRVCAAKHPIEVDAAAPGGEPQRVSCWLHGPNDEIPKGGTEPIERQRFALAEEA
jgi:peptide/nickel transport system ATP-binding protein